MSISREASEIIQDFFPIEEIVACLELEVGIEGNWGQTFLILHSSGVWALSRTSYAEPCRKIRINHHVPMRLQQRQFEETLAFTDEGSTEYTIHVYPSNREPARHFLERVGSMKDILPPLVNKTDKAESAPQTTSPKMQLQNPASITNQKPNAPLPLGTNPPTDAVRGEPIADTADQLDTAGHWMQNFFERIIERIADVPPATRNTTENTHNTHDAPSPDFLRLVDTGDVFSRLPTKQQQAAEAYMAAWEQRPDPTVALKLAALYERLLQPDIQLLWMEKAAEQMPAGAERNAVIDRIVILLEKKENTEEIVSAWKSRRSPK